jgi:hypothetical protein
MAAGRQCGMQQAWPGAAVLAVHAGQMSHGLHLLGGTCCRALRHLVAQSLICLPFCSLLSGEAGAWKEYVKTTYSEAHPNAPKLDDKLFADNAPAQVWACTGSAASPLLLSGRPPHHQSLHPAMRMLMHS